MVGEEPRTIDAVEPGGTNAAHMLDTTGPPLSIPTASMSKRPTWRPDPSRTPSLAKIPHPAGRDDGSTPRTHLLRYHVSQLSNPRDPPGQGITGPSSGNAHKLAGLRCGPVMRWPPILVTPRAVRVPRRA